MNIFIDPINKDWPALLQRPSFDAHNLLPKVQEVLDKVKAKGDEAIKEYTLAFDQVNISSIKLDDDQINQIAVS